MRAEYLLLAVAVVAGCGGSGPSGKTDSGTDVVADVPVDRGGADADAAPPQPDTGRDTGVDNRETGGGETRPDAGADGTAGSLSLLAGAPGGTGTADGVGVAARFTSPASAASDGGGNLYVADGNGIRKIIVATGEVATLAGLVLTPGSADGPCASARFSGPTGLVVDGAGNLFVADTQNHTVRKIVLATCQVTTLAGTAGQPGSTDATGAAASFNSPGPLAMDGTATLYVSDRLNFTLRRVVVNSGVVTTLAGTAGMSGSTDGTGAAARFGDPAGLAMDGAGNMYVADQGNHTIRKVILVTRIVSTFAGSAGMAGVTDAAGVAARFSSPAGLVADGLSNLYVTDRGNSTIRKISLSNTSVTTAAGAAGAAGSTDGTGTTARFSGLMAITADPTSALYISELGNSAIRKMVLDTMAVTTLAGGPSRPGGADGTGAAARFRSPVGLAAGAGGAQVYVVDSDNHAVRTLVVASGVVTTLAGTAGMMGSTDGTGAAARFQAPRGAVFDGAGQLYVADTGNHTIRQIAVAGGAVTTLAGTAGMPGSADGTGAAARFDQPVALALDGAGNLYVSDANNKAIRKVVIASQQVTTLALSMAPAGEDGGTGDDAGVPSLQLDNPRGLVSDGAGHLYVAAASDGRIRRIDLATGQVSLVGVGTSPFAAPGALAIEANGNLLVADPGNSIVGRITLPAGTVTVLVGSPGTAGVELGPLPAGLNQPSGLAVLAGGDLAISDRLENAVLLADF